MEFGKLCGWKSGLKIAYTNGIKMYVREVQSDDILLCFPYSNKTYFEQNSRLRKNNVHPKCGVF